MRARNKKEREQNGVEAIFRPADQSEDRPNPLYSVPRETPGIIRPMKLFLQLQASLILFLFSWLIFAYANSIDSKNYLYEIVSNYLPPLSLLAIGISAVGLSIAWGFVKYRRDQTKLKNPVQDSP